MYSAANEFPSYFKFQVLQNFQNNFSVLLQESSLKSKLSKSKRNFIQVYGYEFSAIVMKSAATQPIQFPLKRSIIRAISSS